MEIDTSNGSDVVSSEIEINKNDVFDKSNIVRAHDDSILFPPQNNHFTSQTYQCHKGDLRQQHKTIKRKGINK